MLHEVVRRVRSRAVREQSCEQGSRCGVLGRQRGYTGVCDLVLGGSYSLRLGTRSWIGLVLGSTRIRQRHRPLGARLVSTRLLRWRRYSSALTDICGVVGSPSDWSAEPFGCPFITGVVQAQERTPTPH